MIKTKLREDGALDIHLPEGVEVKNVNLIETKRKMSSLLKTMLMFSQLNYETIIVPADYIVFNKLVDELRSFEIDFLGNVDTLTLRIGNTRFVFGTTIGRVQDEFYDGAILRKSVINGMFIQEVFARVTLGENPIVVNLLS